MRGWVLLTSAIAALGCGSSEPKHRISADWEDRDIDDCRPPGLEVRVYAPGATLTVAGITADESDSGALVAVVPSGSVPADSRSMKAELALAGARDEVSIRIPTRPTRLLELTYQNQRPEPWIWLGDVELVTGGKGAGSSVWAVGPDEGGRLALPLPCAVTTARAEVGELRVIEHVPTWIVDVDPHLRALTDTDHDPPFRLTINIASDLQKEKEVVFAGKLDAERLLVARYRAVAARPLEWAPAFEPGAKQGAVIVYPEEIDSSLGRGRLTDAALVAVVATTEVARTGCGPYGGPGATNAVSIPRVSIDAAVALLEARTGKQVAHKVFKGRVPGCPDSIVATRWGDGQTSSNDHMVGPVDRKGITAWVKRKLK